jgi:two-component system OmpR family sensor kinase
MRRPRRTDARSVARSAAARGRVTSNLRPSRFWGRLPLRVRLVAGFAAAMLVVLAGAGAFVYLRVQYALDLRLDEDLATQSAQLTDTVRGGTLPSPVGRDRITAAGGSFQVLDADNHVLAANPDLPARSLLTGPELHTATRQPLHKDRGLLLPISAQPLRILAVPLQPGAAPPPGHAAVVLVAVRRDQRDEALRELIAQLTLANLAALAIASVVGYRLAQAALVPVERYRTEAARIAAGATGVRLDVPAGSHDEVTRLGRTLNDMLAALETALERERRFVNDASHELRTPLTLLSTELELALRRPRTAVELEQTLRAAAEDTAGLIALADTLLAVGVQPGQSATAPAIDLSALLTGLLDRYQHSAGLPDTTLHRRIAAGLTVRGDATRLQQVITNLLDNAVRHGTPPITITATHVDGFVQVAVHDTGPGMDPAFLPHAVERFSRADTARTTPGTGLGLSLIDTIVRTHHGQLHLCSAASHHHTDPGFDTSCSHPGIGTTITVAIPAAPTSPARAGPGRTGTTDVTNAADGRTQARP